MTMTLEAPKLVVFTPSPYQQAIFDEVETGYGHIQISAVAGSGKTTTLVELLKRVPYATRCKTLMCAFNREIRDTLAAKAPEEVAVKTNHGIGYGAIATQFGPRGTKFNAKVDDKKYDAIAFYYWTTKHRPVESAPLEEEEFVGKVLHFVRVTLTDCNDPEAIKAMCAEREVDLPATGYATERLLEAIPILLRWGANGLPSPDRDMRTYHPTECIDYDDMIWLPYYLNLRAKKYDLVLVDECQDLSAAQLHLIMKSLATGGRMIAVGDPRQAIYAFTGADAGAFKRIGEELGAKLMPLSVCYRCPRRVIEEAQKLVPEIECSDYADEGVVDTCEERSFMQLVKPLDMILCRTNAPLITTAFRLIIAGKPAKVRGRDIGKNMMKAIDQIEKQPGFFFGNFVEAVEKWRGLQLHLAVSKANAESLIQSANDRADCLLALYEGALTMGAHSTGDLRVYAEDLFTDKKNGSILLSTVHKAKGLEADRVYILRKELMPHPCAKTDAQREQELNLIYVAVTRAQKELFTVVPNQDEN